MTSAPGESDTPNDLHDTLAAYCSPLTPSTHRKGGLKPETPVRNVEKEKT